MGFTTAAALAMQAVGTMKAADAQRQAGQQQKQASDFSAAIAEQQAGQTRATAQRQALNERQKGDIIASRARALAAASGSGATDPTVTNITGNIAGRTEYNALSALFSGEERARGLETDASARRFEGNAAVSSADMKADATLYSGFGTIIGSQGASSLYSKYGSTFGGDSSGGQVRWNSPRYG